MPDGATPDLRDVIEQDDAARASAARRRRWWLRRRLPWWISVGVDRLSVGIVVLVMCIGLVAFALVGARYFLRDDVRLADGAVPANELAVDYQRDLHPRFGQDIAPLQRLRWKRFGRPLHVGPRGVPLIQNERTGDVREMTELEMSFPAGAEYRRDPADRAVVYAPGPNGYAVRWWLPEEFEDLPPARALDRVGWFNEHESRLQQALGDVALGLRHVSGTAPDSWDRRWGEGLVEITDALTERYAYGDAGDWELVGDLLYCSDSLESAYRGGVTQGCPSVGYQDTVSKVWRDLGRMVAVMDRLGRSAALQSHHQVGHLYRDVEVKEYQIDQLALLRSLMEGLEESFALLREYGDAEGYYVQVNLP